MLKITFFYICIGYLCGSLLFAQYAGRLTAGKDVSLESPDQNPGTFNAFKYGGFWCGLITLIGDVLKGFVPVFLYVHKYDGLLTAGLALVMAAPVIGHMFPIFHQFKGGKGIATTFGVLLGLIPVTRPLFILAENFIFFSLIIRITPDSSKTVITYLTTMVILLFRAPSVYIFWGFSLITVFVTGKLFILSRQDAPDREKTKVRLLWKS